MLLLPIQQRAGEGAPDEEAGTAAPGCKEVVSDDGRKVVFEALSGWSPPTTASDPSSGMKLTVKNTFIDVASPEDSPWEGLHTTGAMTCQARLAEPAPQYFNGVDQGADVNEGKDMECSVGAQLTGIPETASTSPVASPFAVSSVGSRGMSSSVFSEDSDVRYTVKNTFIDVEVVGTTPHSAATQSCVARLGATTPQHLPAPPAYVAPIGFEQEPTSPPPSAAPQAPQVGFGPIGSSPGGSSSAGGSPFPEQAISVHNTFIDIGRGQSLFDDRCTVSCTARLSSPTTIGFPSLGGGVGTVAAPVPEAAGKAASPQVAVDPAPGGQSRISIGSDLHGTVGKDGQPACLPCAWFYKESGCMNAKDCRYCHVCPQGELKTRKKQKIARLRQQEAEAAATLAAAAGSAAPGGKSGGK